MTFDRAGEPGPLFVPADRAASPAVADATLVAGYAEHRMAAIMALPRIKAGMLIRMAQHQIVPSRPTRPYVVDYRLSDRPAALVAVAATGLNRPPASAGGRSS